MIIANKNKVVEMANNLSESDSGTGRSLWNDARTRFIHNKAATVSLFVLIAIVAFSFIGPYFAVWSNEQIDWNTMGSAATLGMPSLFITSVRIPPGHSAFTVIPIAPTS